MCVICIKAPGVSFPDYEKVENMFLTNPDGAGFVYSLNGEVHIRKGFMTLLEFDNALQQLKALPGIDDETVIMHFRIGTAGGNIPENTHPFPMSKGKEQLRSLSLDGKFTAIAHNGIIPINRPDKSISDTMEYIRTKLVNYRKRDKTFLQKKICLEQIAREINGSRMVFLHPDGTFEKVGTWYTENDGLIYSNLHWKPLPASFRKNRFSPLYSYGWDWDDGYYYDGFDSPFSNKIKVGFLPIGSYFLDLDTGDMIDDASVPFDIVMDSRNRLYLLVWSDDLGDYAMYEVEEDLVAFGPDGNEIDYMDCDTIDTITSSGLSASIFESAYDDEEVEDDI